MNLIKFNRYLEIFWWIVTVITLVLVLVMCFTESFDRWTIYFLVPALAALMALVRRFMGKKLAKSHAEKEAREKLGS